MLVFQLKGSVQSTVIDSYIDLSSLTANLQVSLQIRMGGL